MTELMVRMFGKDMGKDNKVLVGIYCVIYCDILLIKVVTSMCYVISGTESVKN